MDLSILTLKELIKLRQLIGIELWDRYWWFFVTIIIVSTMTPIVLYYISKESE